MKVGDLVTIAGPMERLGGDRCLGIIVCIDPEEIGDNDEVAVQWTSGFTDCIGIDQAQESNHSTWNLKAISESR